MACVRGYAKKEPIEEAVEHAVTECIQKGILADFLTEQRSEVKAMSIFEYNEEEEKRKLREAERAAGRAEGRAEGTAAAILVLLEEAGTVPEKLRTRILQMQDRQTLYRWLKLAAKVESPEDFWNRISKDRA